MLPSRSVTNWTPGWLSTSSHPYTTICGAFCGVRFPGGAGDAIRLLLKSSCAVAPSIGFGLHIVVGGISGGPTVPLLLLLPPRLDPPLPDPPLLDPLPLAPLLPPE